MKRGFTLIETLASIAILSVLVLAVYSFVINILNNNEDNLMYDDVANIYEVYYLKEYLDVNGLHILKDNSLVKKINCDNFGDGCKKIQNSFFISDMYLVRNMDDYNNIDKELARYLKLLKKDSKYDYYLVVKFANNNYASLGVN